jgi:lipid A disaccharide synthetase
LCSKKENIRIFYANETSKLILENLLPSEYHEYLVSGKDTNKVSDCKKALCASGTITLELALLEIPMIIMYKLSYFSYLIMKSLINVKYIGLVNLILGNSIGSAPVVKEFIQPSYSDQVDIMVELNKIDQDEFYRNSIIDKYKSVKQVILSALNKDNLSSRGLVDFIKILKHFSKSLIVLSLKFFRFNPSELILYALA